MKHHPICPHCGFDLDNDQPIVIDDFFMFGPGAPLCYQGRPLRLTGAEAAVAWTLIKACPALVRVDVILDRIGSEANLEAVGIFIHRIRRKLREAGASDMIAVGRRGGKRAYRWKLQNEVTP